MVGCLVALKMSWTFFPSLTMLWCSVRNMWGTNCYIQAGTGMTKLFRSSLFTVFKTLSMFLLIEGLFLASHYHRKFSHEQVVLKMPGHPKAMIRLK